MENYIKIKLKILFIKLSIKFNRKLFNSIANHLLKIKKNRIVFANFHGMGYGCNPKYIAEEMIRQKLPLDMYWVVDHTRAKDFSSIPKEIKRIEKFSLYFWYIMATSKFWIVNTTLQMMSNIDKRPEQIYIQTGHGSLGIKKIGMDDASTDDYKTEIINKEATEIDYFISNSEFETNVFHNGFKYPRERIVELGHARNDVFFDNNSYNRKVRKFYNLKDDDKILLYVPTFRKDGRFDCFNIEYNDLIKELGNKFGGNWNILVRFHPRTIPFIEKFFKPEKNIIDATKYEDIQELLVASDIAITDYSSCIFDFVLTKKPAFIYATDYEQFDDDQGCYYPLTDTPFPIATNNHELLNNIKDFDKEKYKKKVEEFLKEKGCIDDGKASKRIVEHITGIKVL